MKKVYFDNAATTPMDKSVIEAILPIMQSNFGNPSSTHTFGRHAKAAIETSRRKIAELISASPSEIVFTSGGTEANNMALNSAINDLGVKHIITSPIEHHAVLDTVENLKKLGKIKLSLVKLLPNGHIDLKHLEDLLHNENTTLVSLMHANNEVGNLLPLKKVSDLCEKYNAFLHSDTVQTMGHYKINTKNTKIHFLTCSAHKFHGPKGVGFLYVNKNIQLSPMLIGGGQERKMRAGTENIYGIVGLAKALEICNSEMEKHQKHIQGIKSYMIEQLKQLFYNIKFNGDINPDTSLYTVLNISLPHNAKANLLLFSLDINGIAASGGSACSAGSNIGSHVIKALKSNIENSNIRFSFSKYNTKEEVDYCLKVLKNITKD